MSNYILPFEKISKKNVNIAGGKGANLGELAKAGFPVPPGFVVLASAYDQYLRETNINVEIQAKLDKLNHKDLISVDRMSHDLRYLIHNSKMPKDLINDFSMAFKKLKAKFVAVRSSATAEDSSVASWAGELETYLFVTDKKLTEMIKTCWSSLFTPRAIFYRFEKKLNKTKVSVAVVIQKMINSEISGVCFTAHPVTKDRNQMVIEAGYGLGEAIVSGMITPDTYIINKKEKSIVDINISKQKKMIVAKPAGGTKTVAVKKSNQEKQVLSGQKIMSLTAICQKIEKHYKKPQDIEWAYEKGKFYITQTRPITTL